jgi:predicted nucleotidyltransferase
MELHDGVLSMQKELTELDRDVLEFVSILDAVGIDYVIISGYVAILTGRTRGTEDVDVFIEEVEPEVLETLTSELEANDYWCLNAPFDEMHSMLADEIAVRIAPEGDVIPNFEVSFADDHYSRLSLSDRLRVEMDGEELYVGPLELQIAFKLRLGSEKDFEDALHLLSVFEGQLDTATLEMYVTELGVEEEYHELTDV